MTPDHQAAQSSEQKQLPVTLLSGFLGAGKTTLLERILTSPSHGLKIGVIVNDVGALNIDAALLRNHEVTIRNEEVVELQNGCICCTLRGDLLGEVARLAQDGRVDYLIIESSGVSEPMQVAEAFSDEFAHMHVAAAEELQSSEEGNTEKTKRLLELLEQGGLSTIARLDTCVTLVDAINFMADFETADFLVDRHAKENVPQEDDRNISDLQTDQIEFADVIIINKCDLVSQNEINKIKAVVSSLNPSASILTSTKAKIDIAKIVDTKLFSYEKAATGAGWLRSLKEEVLPETEEYGIGTFVYRARRPFHPARLWHTIKKVFVVIQTEYINDGISESDEDQMTVDEDEKAKDIEDGGSDDSDNDESSGSQTGESSSDTSDTSMDLDERLPQLNPGKRLAAKQADATFGPLLRSKGFFWLATRPTYYGEWSQAGVMLTLSAGGFWYAEVPEDEWTQEEDVRKAIRKDFEGVWGDRRQEIVFIGQQMSTGGGKDRITKAMDACLLNDKEMRDFERAMSLKTREAQEERLSEIFEDGFEDWPDMSLDDGHDHEGHNHSH